MKKSGSHWLVLETLAKHWFRLLDNKQDNLRNEYGFSTLIIGIATGRHGMAINPKASISTKPSSLRNRAGL